MSDETQVQLPSADLGEKLMEGMEGAECYVRMHEAGMAESPHPLVGCRVGRVMIVCELVFEYADGDTGSVITYGAAKNTASRYDQEMLLRQARKQLRAAYKV